MDGKFACLCGLPARGGVRIISLRIRDFFGALACRKSWKIVRMICGGQQKILVSLYIVRYILIRGNL